MLSLAFVLPNVFAAAYFAAFIVVAGAVVCWAFVVVSYLLSGVK